MTPTVTISLAAGFLIILSGVAGLIQPRGCARTRVKHLTLLGVIVLGVTLGPFVQIGVTQLSHSERVAIILMWALVCIVCIGTYQTVRWIHE